MQHVQQLKVWRLVISKMVPVKDANRSVSDFCNDARQIFEKACKAVQPGVLMHKNVEVQSNNIVILGNRFPLKKNVYIVGFGKAVLGMALVLEHKLKEHLVSGILSVPYGMKISGQNVTEETKSVINIYEGAVNNIPDKNSLEAAIKIKELVQSLTERDLLIVLISGGGSALLSAPKPPLTLEEKRKVISLLTSKGASIEQLNTVRKRLSTLKGGKLALLAKPATVVSLILSDIINDPLDMIASGPTVLNTDGKSLPHTILEKYNLLPETPKTVIQLLLDDSTLVEPNCFSHVSNFIIGNNTTALNAAAELAVYKDYTPIIMTQSLQGIARDVGKKLIQLIIAALQQNIGLLDKLYKELHLQPDSKTLMLDHLKSTELQEKKVCLLFGGETTVEVKGKGIGGRNQELALSAALELDSQKSSHDIVLLSAGTDGIDGPTSAAGAVVTTATMKESRKKNLDAIRFLSDNDSNTFFNKVNDEWLLKPGHTGTNVMDIVIILIT